MKILLPFRAKARLLSIIISTAVFALGCTGKEDDCETASNCQDLTELSPNFSAPASFNVSGRLNIQHLYRIDSDTPLHLSASNPRSLASNDNNEQLLPNPVSLNGYLALERKEVENQPYLDTQDTFRIIFKPNDELVLETSANLEVMLEILTVDGTLVHSFSTTNNRAKIDIADHINLEEYQQHLLVIQPINGLEGSYRLSVKEGLRTLNVAHSALKKQRSLKPAGSKTEPTGEIIVKFRASTDKMLSNSLLSVEHCQFTKLHTSRNFGRYKLTDTENTQLSMSSVKDCIKQLENLSNVLYVEENLPVKASSIPNDPLLQRQWHLEQLKIYEAWQTTLGSADVKVAVIDTGIIAHPDLPDFSLNGFDFISDPKAAGDGDGPDTDPFDEGDARLPGEDDSFHGSHMTGIIAARTNNNLGIAGINSSVNIFPLRVLGRDGGTTFDVAQAILYAAGEPNSSDRTLDEPVDIINMSLGTPESSELLKEAASIAYQKGVIIVAAAGNDGRSGLDFPAALNTVIAVGAVDGNNNITEYSNLGDLDLVAPGGLLDQDLNMDEEPDGILSTAIFKENGFYDADYVYFEGTSAATAQVTGIIALMKSLHPMLSPDQLNMMIAGGEISIDLGAKGHDMEYGYGLIQADAAVSLAQTLANEPVFLTLDQGIFYIELFEVSTSGAIPIKPSLVSPIIKENGRYSFSLTNITAGKYALRVGQDLNSNGIICEATFFELCSTGDLNEFINIELSQDTASLEIALSSKESI